MDEAIARHAQRVEEIAGGFRAAQVLFTACRLKLFDALADTPKSGDALAAALGTDPRATRILCDALAALGLLEKHDGLFSNAPAATACLVCDAPASRMGILLHGAQLYARWGGLFDVVRSGKPVPPEAIDPALRGDERAFAMAMADVGRASAVQTAQVVDLSSVGRLLDLGGGPGLYAVAFVRRWPSLHVVVMDTPQTLEVARENAEAAGVRDRITLRPGNFLEDDLGSGYGAVLLSNVVHIFGDETNARLVARCAAALDPGGCVIVKDFALDCDRTSPAIGALFAVNMLVNTDGGDCYTPEQVRRWFECAGLVFEAQHELAMASRLYIGRKPV